MFQRLLAACAASVAAASVLAFGASSAFAANPGHTSCDSVNGQINGRGATFQTTAHTAVFTPGFNAQCGLTAPATMVQYNYSASTGFQGSGNGQKAVSCRTDPFGGTDIPYDSATLGSLNGAPGATGGCAISFTPPNPPNVAPFPDAFDTSAQLMTFPVAVGADGVGFRLTSTACGGASPPSSLSLTGQMVSGLFGGDILSWNDARLRNGGLNPALANCNTPVIRVVRLEKSGTTQIFKNYLAKVDPNRSGATCAPANGWTFYAQDAQNTNWPTGGSECSALIRPDTSGNLAVVTKCKATIGGICYADIADALQNKLKLAKVRNGTDTAFQASAANDPVTLKKTRANCDPSAASLPGTTASDAVGLNASDTWAIDNASGNHADITNVGKKYPICGLTFDMVYAGLSGSTNSAIARLRNDQRQTIYDYFSYVLSNPGQSGLSQHYYAQLPSTWLARLQTGFQLNF